MEELFTKSSIKSIADLIGEAAMKIAQESNADGIVTVTRKDQAQHSQESPFFEVKVSIFKKTIKKYDKVEYVVRLKRPEAGMMIPIKELVMTAVTNKDLKKGDRIICVLDDSIGPGYRGAITVFDVDSLFVDVTSNHLSEGLNPEVVETTLTLALEIAREGREGRAVGTGFIIGPRDAMKYAKQLIINPFQNLDESLRNITNPELNETMKEFSQLDGVFFIDPEGVILSAGTYIDIDTEELPLAPGLGTKHRNCAAITAKTPTIAIVVSESGGKVRVFKNGRVVLTL